MDLQRLKLLNCNCSESNESWVIQFLCLCPCLQNKTWTGRSQPNHLRMRSLKMGTRIANASMTGDSSTDDAQSDDEGNENPTTDAVPTVLVQTISTTKSTSVVRTRTRRSLEPYVVFTKKAKNLTLTHHYVQCTRGNNVLDSTSPQSHRPVILR